MAERRFFVFEHGTKFVVIQNVGLGFVLASGTYHNSRSEAQAETDLRNAREKHRDRGDGFTHHEDDDCYIQVNTGDEAVTHSGGKPHTTVGDRGQRYEIRMTGYPKDGENVLGWSNTLDGAEEMKNAILQAPGCTSATIFDRQEQQRAHYHPFRRCAALIPDSCGGKDERP